MVGENDDNDPELRKAQVLNTKAKEERTLLDHLSKFSDWKRTVKAIAHLKSFAKEIKGLKPKQNEATSVKERQEAEFFIMKLAQKEAFKIEIKNLQQRKEIKSNNRASKLLQLSSFLEENAVLRVGGCLKRSSLHPHVKYPAIVPKASHVSSLLIKHYH